MSKIIDDCLTRSGTGCFIAVAIWQWWASKVRHGSYCLALQRHSVLTSSFWSSVHPSPWQPNF